MIFNVVPVDFSREKVRIGQTPYVDEAGYRALRELHWRTHTFRYDRDSGAILNIPVLADVDPLGTVEEVDIRDYLALVARAVQHATLVWIAGRLPVLKGGKQLTFWGQADHAHLLTQTLTKLELSSIPGLEVTLRYNLDCRIFYDAAGSPFLGLTIGVATTNIIEIPVADLLKRHMHLMGREVCRRRQFEHDYLQPGLETLGRIAAIQGQRIKLTDAVDVEQVDASSILLQPTLSNLRDVIALYFGPRSQRVLTELNTLRQRVASSAGKLAQIRATLNGLRQRQMTIGKDVEIVLGELLESGDPRFPAQITTEPPTLLFGPQGRNTESNADPGIKRFGPYMYMQHPRNAPTIGVICEQQYQGRVEQFVKMLLEGYPDELWRGNWNPFEGGLIGKFRLSSVQIEFETCADSTATAYRAAARRLLQRLPKSPDLALVQVKEEHKQRFGDASPYYVSKAVFMTAGVPTQSLRMENIDQPGSGVAYILNNLALACYAKLEGIPWVIATRGPAMHELVIGIGSAEVAHRSKSERTRYFGITTMFQGDGRYLVWDLTREAVFEEYTAALIESLRTALRYVRQQNGWQPGDKVRLVCHAYKRLKNCEIDAIKQLVGQLLDEQFDVKFAFLDLSPAHPYYLFDPTQPGVTYGQGRQRQLKGEGVPARGICLQLDDRRALLQLTGSKEVKMAAHGLPQPLLVELHSDSDFADLTYLVRQIYHFTYMSWRTFFLATAPVTITYSQRIADLLGHLNAVRDWTSASLALNSLRGRRWFL